MDALNFGQPIDNKSLQTTPPSETGIAAAEQEKAASDREQIRKLNTDKEKSKKEINEKNQEEKREDAAKKNNKEKEKDKDKKKKKEPKKNNWGKFAGQAIGGIVYVMFSFVVGARYVLAGKIAQMNILPTDIYCMPYAPAYDRDPAKSPEYQTNNPEASIDVITINSGGDPLKYATKLGYDTQNKENRTFKILDYIRTHQYDNKVDTFTRYMCVVFTQLFVLFYGCPSWIYNKTNEKLPEWLNILIGPSIVFFCVLISLFVAPIASFIIGIMNIQLLSERNMNTDPEFPHKDSEKPIWREIPPGNDLMTLMGTGLYYLFGVLFSCFVGWTGIPSMIAYICIISPLLSYAPTILTGPNAGKPYGWRSSIKGLIETKLWLFALFISIAVANASRSLIMPITIGLVLASLYFVYSIYSATQKVPESAVEGLTTYDQYLKYCPRVPVTKKGQLEQMRDAKIIASQPPQSLGEAKEKALGMFNSFRDKANASVKEAKNKAHAAKAEAMENAKIAEAGKSSVLKPNMPTPSADVKILPETKMGATKQKGGDILQRKVEEMKRAMR